MGISMGLGDGRERGKFGGGWRASGRGGVVEESDVRSLTRVHGVVHKDLWCR